MIYTEYLILDKEDKKIKPRKVRNKRIRKQRKKRNKNHVDIVCKVNECPKCKNTMETRKHKNISAKQLKQPFYFSQWDYCTNCKYIQTDEAFKVWNRNEKAKKLVEMVEYRQVKEWWKTI